MPSPSCVGGVAVAARNGREVAVAQFERDGAGAEVAAQQPGGRVARHLGDLVPHLGHVGEVGGEGRSRCPTISARAPRRPGRSSMAVRQLLSQSASEPTAARRRAGSAVRTSIRRVMPRARSLAAVTGPTPHSASTASSVQEVLDALRRDHGQPVGLLPARGDLRQELVGRDAGRGRQAGGGADLRLEPPRDVHAERLAPGVLGDVEIGLVERQRLDERRDRAEEAEHRSDTALYLAKSGRTMTRSGQSRTARDIGIADRTPNSRAS